MTELLSDSLPVFYGLFFLTLVFFTVLINKILLKFSTNLGVRNEEMVRWTATVKPALGGISFYIMFLLASAGYLACFSWGASADRLQLFLFLVVCTMGFMMGLADDAYNTRPALKFLVQFACGFLFILSGNYIKTTPYEWMNYTLTVLWVVGLMNSINMLDNMDGITTSTSLGIIVGATALMALNGKADSFWFAVALGVGASLIGFLYHNWHPSVMYMGDTGSQFLGVFLAWIGVKAFWNGTDAFGEPIQSKQVVTAALMFLGPISDTTAVTVNRLLRGQSPFVGGRDHTTHSLVYNGVAERHVAFIYLGIPLVSSAICVFFVNFTSGWNGFHTTLCAVYFLAVSGGLYYVTKTKRTRAKLNP